MTEILAAVVAVVVVLARRMLSSKFFCSYSSLFTLKIVFYFASVTTHHELLANDSFCNPRSRFLTRGAESLNDKFQIGKANMHGYTILHVGDVKKKVFLTLRVSCVFDCVLTCGVSRSEINSSYT